MVTVEQVLASEFPLTLVEEFDGSCPCALILGKNFEINVHCWRVCQRCQWSGVHVKGLELELAQKVAEHVRDNNGWTNHTDWTIVIEEEKTNGTKSDTATN